MCTLTLAAGELYMAICGHPLLDAAAWMKLIGMIALNTLVYASLSYLLALFIHSESAWNSIFTIIGTLVGFVGAIYLPMAMLPDGVSSVLKCLPVLHGAAMMRKICTADAIAKTFDGLPSAAGASFCEQMGVTVKIQHQGTSTEILLYQQILFLMICAIIAVAVSVLVIRRRRLRDRWGILRADFQIGDEDENNDHWTRGRRGGWNYYPLPSSGQAADETDLCHQGGGR